MKQLPEYLANIGLTETQLVNKQNYIGGSSAKDIADGNWGKVYDQMINGGEDLSHIFKVQLGHVTEEFNLLWFAENMKFEWMDLDYLIWSASKKHPFIGCLPDALMRRPDNKVVVIDAKHTGALTPWWDEAKVAEYYFPQMQHNMIATDTDEAYLSVIFGNDAPVPIHIEYDHEWGKNYINLCSAFWSHIKRSDRPEDGADSLEVPKIILDDMRELDMTEGNTKADWEIHAEAYLNLEIDAGMFELAKKGLKKMVPDDVKKATGAGIEIHRSKSGSLTFRNPK